MKTQEQVAKEVGDQFITGMQQLIDTAKVGGRQALVAKFGKPLAFSKERITVIRKSLGVKRVAFAKLLRVKPSTVRAWEAGTRRPPGPALVLYEMIEADPVGWHDRCLQIAGA